MIELAHEIRRKQMNIYDLGDISKYQLSKYSKDVKHEDSQSFVEIFRFIMNKVPHSKIILIGGSDEICKTVYKSHLFENIIHIESQIDVKD